SSELPGLEVSLRGDPFEVGFGVDVGPLARVADVARQLEDLDRAVCLGERWGITIGRAVSYRELVGRWGRPAHAPSDAARASPVEPDLADEAHDLGFGPDDVEAVDRWLYGPPWDRGRYAAAEAVVRALADYRMGSRLGSATGVVRVAYENPLE